MIVSTYIFCNAPEQSWKIVISLNFDDSAILRSTSVWVNR